jgi:hypothetical protein
VVSSLRKERSADRPHCHSGIFFHKRRFFRSIWRVRSTGLGDFAVTRFALQQNRNEISVLPGLGRVEKIVALALLIMQPRFAALFFLTLWSIEGVQRTGWLTVGCSQRHNPHAPKHIATLRLTLSTAQGQLMPMWRVLLQIPIVRIGHPAYL